MLTVLFIAAILFGAYSLLSSLGFKRKRRFMPAFFIVHKRSVRPFSGGRCLFRIPK